MGIEMLADLVDLLRALGRDDILAALERGDEEEAERLLGEWL